MSKANLDLVRAVYAAREKGDVAGIGRNMAPDIEWNEAEGFPFADGNPYCGPDAIITGIFQRGKAEWDGLCPHPTEFLDAGDTIVVLGRYKGIHRITGRQLDAQLAHIWRIRDGAIIGFQQYTDTMQAAQVTGAAWKDGI